MRNRFARLVKQLARDESGASLLEYTILLGIVASLSVVTVGKVGTWVSGKWTALATALGIT